MKKHEYHLRGYKAIVNCLNYQRKIQRYEVYHGIRQNHFSGYAMFKADERFRAWYEREESQKLYEEGYAKYQS